MKKRKILIIFLYLIASLIGVSFAWMTGYDSEEREKNQAKIEYDGINRKLSIDSSDITFELFVLKDNVYQSVDTQSSDDSLISSNVIPNEKIYFRFDFKNKSESNKTIDIKITNMTIGDDSQSNIFEYLYFSIYRVEAYYTDSSGLSRTDYYEQNSITSPQGSYKCFKGIDQSTHFTDTIINNVHYYSSLLQEDICIPSTNNSNPSKVSLFGYILLSKEVNSDDHQNLDLNLGYFQIEE